LSSRLKESPAQIALMSANHEKALALLHNDRSPGAVILRARALYRLGFFIRAIAEADEAKCKDLVLEEEVALVSLHSFVLARIGRLDEAYARLSALEVLIQEVPNTLFELELDSTRAYLYYCTNRYEQCLVILQEIIKKTSSLHEDIRLYPFQQDEFGYRSKAATLLGIIYGSRDDFVRMERWHCEAILSAECSSPRDAFLEANVLANLSCALIEVNCPSAIQILHDRLFSMKWTSGLDEQHLHVTRNLRHANNVFGIGKKLPDSDTTLSPSLAWRLAESVDKLLTESWASNIAFNEELSFAKTFITRVDWIATSGEESAHLDELVPVLAPFDVVAASEAKMRHDMKIKVALPHFPSGRTARDKSSSHFAAACIAKANANWALAELEFTASLEGMLQSGILWRAAIAAVELFTLTRSQRLLETPRQFISNHPGTPFSRRLGRALQLSESADRSAFPYLHDAIAG
jgi:tetratricopeptide (TPR) repeat protein